MPLWVFDASKVNTIDIGLQWIKGSSGQQSDGVISLFHRNLDIITFGSKILNNDHIKNALQNRWSRQF